MINQAQVTITKQGLQLNGSMVYASVSTLLEEGTHLLENHPETSISIDCKNVSRVDSAGIALLIEWKRKCINHKKNCQIIGLPKQARSLVETYRLQEVL